MKQPNKIQTAIILFVLMLVIWLRFRNPYQSLLLEMIFDLFIVVIFLGFSEVLISALVLFPMFLFTKAFQFLKTQSTNR